MKTGTRQPIGSQGCTLMTGIMLAGPYRGQVVYYDEDFCGPPFFVREKGFLAWYEWWLREVKEAWYERVFEILPKLRREGFRDACHTISAVKDYPNVHAGRLREALNRDDLDRNDRIALFHCIQKL